MRRTFDSQGLEGRPCQLLLHDAADHLKRPENVNGEEQVGIVPSPDQWVRDALASEILGQRRAGVFLQHRNLNWPASGALQSLPSSGRGTWLRRSAIQSTGKILSNNSLI